MRRIEVFDGNFCRINDGRALDLRVATDLGPIWIAARRLLTGRDDSLNYLPSEKRLVNTEWKMNLQAYRGKWPFETRPSGSTTRKSRGTEMPPENAISCSPVATVSCGKSPCSIKHLAKFSAISPQ